MAKFTLEWRQFRGETAKPAFLHRMAYSNSRAGIFALASSLEDTAWRREFRIIHAGCDVFTNLHYIEDWKNSSTLLPVSDQNHVWRLDLKRDLSADRFLSVLVGSAEPAVAARVLRRADADTLVRFARKSLRRPRL